MGTLRVIALHLYGSDVCGTQYGQSPGSIRNQSSVVITSPILHTQSRQYLEDNPISQTERKGSWREVPSLRSKLEIGVVNPNLWASTLIVIVLMIVSPKIVASEKIVSPFAANCTDDLSISET